MADIFISYKRENRPYAERFAEQFSREGLSVWWDDDISSRQAWDATIEREISACSAVVVLWTPLSIASDWVRTEAHYGHDHGKLVPVMIERCDPPLAFRLTQTVDLIGWDGQSNRLWRKLLTWIADLKAPAVAGAADGAVPANPFRDAIGQLATGEAIVDGALVNAATPAGALFRDGADGPVMRILPAGDFLLGASLGDPDSTSFETPQRRITLGRRFAMGVYPLTCAEYAKFGPAAPGPAQAPQKPSGGWFGGANKTAAAAAPAPDPTCAASRISFDDARAYLGGLSRAAGVAYRLPSEAEWEYACRAGGSSRYAWGDDIDAARALYRSPNATHAGPCAPGRFAANAFGLYDMHGNVREWVEDLWRETLDLAPPDGRPSLDGHSSMRVTRGGAWSDPPAILRCSARGRATESIRADSIGLRVVRAL